MWKKQQERRQKGGAPRRATAGHDRHEHRQCKRSLKTEFVGCPCRAYWTHPKRERKKKGSELISSGEWWVEWGEREWRRESEWERVRRESGREKQRKPVANNQTGAEAKGSWTWARLPAHIPKGSAKARKKKRRKERGRRESSYSEPNIFGIPLCSSFFWLLLLFLTFAKCRTGCRSRPALATGQLTELRGHWGLVRQADEQAGEEGEVFHNKSHKYATRKMNENGKIFG